MGRRDEKAANLVKELAAVFLERENNSVSLITVTRADVSSDLRNATVYISVLPEEQALEALEFARRKRSDLRDYLKANMQVKNVPFVEIEIEK
ncbi:MAG: ribosome-binding factor A [Patescibacteria group bacterium]